MSAVLLSLLLSTPVSIAGTREAVLHRPEGAGPFPAVLMIEGWWTMGPSLEDARRFEAAAKGTASEVRIYVEAQHGFADPKNAWGGYDETAARDSWARAVAFLDARLAGPAPTDSKAAAPVASATGAGSRAAVDCVMAAWNAYDVEASRKCYADDAVSRNAHGVVPIDWAFERNLRAFDRVARSKFRAEVRQADGSNADFKLHETNDFIAALGLESVTAIWRYTVKDGRVAEEDLQQADAAFRTSLRKLTQWGRSTKPAGWDAVVDSEGIVRFDASTAETLIRLAKEFTATP